MRSDVYWRYTHYSKIELHHARDLRRVLEKLRQNKLYMNAENNEFSLREFEFLGHVLSGNGIRLDSMKIQVIREWEVSRMQKKNVISMFGQVLPKVH